MINSGRASITIRMRGLTICMTASLCVAAVTGCASSVERGEERERRAAYCETMRSMKYGEFMTQMNEIQEALYVRKASRTERKAAKRQLNDVKACMKASAPVEGRRIEVR